MTELQVKTQKGSLKKFLAMFLAFCVCVTTVFVDGAFAQAAGEEGGFSVDVTVTAGNSTKVNVDQTSIGTGRTVTGDNAKNLKAGWNKVDGNADITVSGTTKTEISVAVASTVSAGNYDIKVAFAEDIATVDNASAKIYEGTLNVVVGSKNNPDNPDDPDDPEGNVTPSDASFKQSSYTLGRGANDKVDLGAEVSPSNATKTNWASNNSAKIAVSNTGVVTLTAAGKADKNAITATISVKANNKDITCTVNVAKDSTPIPPVVTDKVTGVTVNPTTLALKVGGTGDVKATVKAEGKAATTVTWSSSNDKVATVKDGKVTAVAEGKANIVATSTFDKTKTATCAVTVTAEDKKDDKPVDTTVAVTGISLNAKTIYLKTGTKFNAKAVVAPANATDKKVTWTSNKKTIATVNGSGVISAKKKTGKATITAKAGTKSAKITVNVVKKAKKTTSIKLSKSKVTLTAKAQAALSATLSKGATSKVTWATSDKKVATVKDGVVTAKKKGVAVITATADGKSAECVVTVKDAKGKKAAALKVKTKKITVKVKKTKKIAVTLAKKDSVKSYVSSNKKIATVSKKGVVTGKKKGKATIIVTTKKGAVATIPVTVK